MEFDSIFTRLHMGVGYRVGVGRRRPIFAWRLASTADLCGVDVASSVGRNFVSKTFVTSGRRGLNVLASRPYPITCPLI